MELGLTLGAPPDGIQGVSTLDGTKLDGVTVDAKKLVIPVPENIRDDIDTILVLTLGKWIDSNPKKARIEQR